MVKYSLPFPCHSERSRRILSQVRLFAFYVRQLLHNVQNLFEKPARKLRRNFSHPSAKNNQRHQDSNQFWNKGQRLLLNGGCRLKDTDYQADNQADSEHGHRKIQNCHHRFPRYICNNPLIHVILLAEAAIRQPIFCLQLKLLTMVSATRFHPPTEINSRILKGSDIMTGGSIIIPIDIRVLATTMSITKNGI